jgi:hypothetical protein
MYFLQVVELVMYFLQVVEYLYEPFSQDAWKMLIVSLVQLPRLGICWRQRK